MYPDLSCYLWSVDVVSLSESVVEWNIFTQKQISDWKFTETDLKNCWTRMVSSLQLFLQKQVESHYSHHCLTIIFCELADIGIN